MGILILATGHGALNHVFQIQAATLHLSYLSLELRFIFHVIDVYVDAEVCRRMFMCFLPAAAHGALHEEHNNMFVRVGFGVALSTTLGRLSTCVCEFPSFPLDAFVCSFRCDVRHARQRYHGHSWCETILL